VYGLLAGSPMIAEVTPNEIELSKIISVTLTDSQLLAGFTVWL